ncbi:MAG: DASS family sodium-coupled anion symporter [Nitrospirota bacterium]
MPLDVKETYSKPEERFNRLRAKFGLWAGPLFALIVYLLPLPISDAAHRLAALMVGMVIYWIAEPIPIAITALLVPILAILFGIGKDKEVIASFGNPVLFLFIGSFMIARAMEKHRLDRRFSFWLLSVSGIGKSPFRILLMLGLITMTLSMWISNTAATAMLFPIALGVLRFIIPKTANEGDSDSSVYATGVMLMIAFAASVGGIATPIGTPPNLIGIGMIEKEIGTKISFFQWMQFGLPIVFVMYFILCLLLSFLFPSDGIATTGLADFIQEQKKSLGDWTRAEKNTLIVFFTAVLLWIMPGILGLLFDPKGAVLTLYNARLPEGAIAILSASLLFFLPVNREKGEYTLSWDDAVSIDWGTILLFGGGLAMGDLMFKTGLSSAMGEGLLSLLSVRSLWGITGLSIALAIGISELSSNTASANMVIPVVIAMAIASGANPIPPALGATIGASFGFMLPISTPPNAIVYGSGLIPIRAMMRAGIFLDLIGFFVIWGVLWFLCPLLGLAG